VRARYGDSLRKDNLGCGAQGDCVITAPQQPHMGAALMQLEPALLDGVADAGTELATLAAEREQERRVDLLMLAAR